MVLKALFGIPEDVFIQITEGLDDSGIILTKVFNYVLGGNRDGIGGTNQFSSYAGSVGRVGAFAAGAKVSDFFQTHAPQGADDCMRLKTLLKYLRSKKLPDIH